MKSSEFKDWQTSCAILPFRCTVCPVAYRHDKKPHATITHLRRLLLGELESIHDRLISKGLINLNLSIIIRRIFKNLQSCIVYCRQKGKLPVADEIRNSPLSLKMWSVPPKFSSVSPKRSPAPGGWE